MGLRTKQLSGDQDSDRGARFTAEGRPSSEALTCPRCGSTNTKFCYYNNYNKSQPRHFCKACKRHWTKGGVLRNIPVGGVRKNKRPKSSIPAEDRWKSLSATVLENHHKNSGSCPNPIEEKATMINLTNSSSHVSPLAVDSLELETSSLTSLDIPTMSGSFWPALNSGIGDYWNFDELDLSTYSVMDTATEFNNLKP